jgi:predicted O-methyltransferase YrrM
VTTEIAGQLNAEERALLTRAITEAPTPPEIVLEVGTWLGGGSTVNILRALEKNGRGHLWGIEADRSVYDQMLANLRAAAPETLHRFTPLFGISQQVIPPWLRELGHDARVDLAFLDGGDNPMEQVTEFQLLDGYFPIGGRLLAHDAKLRKGKWLVPYLKALDHWQSTVHDISEEGLLEASKISIEPTEASATRAQKILQELRRGLVERLGAFLPASVNSMIFRLLPAPLVRKLTQGRS